MNRAALRAHVTLYAVATGATYHRSEACEGLNAYHSSMGWNARVPVVTRRQAEARGLRACKVCQPPPMLVVVDDPLEGT